MIRIDICVGILKYVLEFLLMLEERVDDVIFCEAVIYSRS